jgi:hypothetical protein
MGGGGESLAAFMGGMAFDNTLSGDQQRAGSLATGDVGRGAPVDHRPQYRHTAASLKAMAGGGGGGPHATGGCQGLYGNKSGLGGTGGGSAKPGCSEQPPSAGGCSDDVSPLLDT